MIGRIQHPIYTAVALKTANPVLLDGEIVYESDTGRHKIGDGVSSWNILPYATNAEEVPGVSWKVENGTLYVKPATDLKNPILRRCMVGVLHYKNAKSRYLLNQMTGTRLIRPQNIGFKLVQDCFARTELNWTTVRINPVPFDSSIVDAAGWMPLISVSNIINRWIESIPDPNFAGGGKFALHRGTKIGHKNIGSNALGQTKIQVSFYGGVVLFVNGPKQRVEGPRAFFKAVVRNSDSTHALMHI